MMNHVSEATSDKVLLLRIPKRLRRALPRISMGNGSKSVRLVPYDEKAAKAQKIVSSDECVEDTYIGHINTSTHLIIASEESLWAIDRKSRKPMCFSWEEISHFTILQDGAIRVSIFSHVGLKPFTIQVENSASFEALLRLLSMQVAKMVSLSLSLWYPLFCVSYTVIKLLFSFLERVIAHLILQIARMCPSVMEPNIIPMIVYPVLKRSK